MNSALPHLVAPFLVALGAASAAAQPRSAGPCAPTTGNEVTADRCVEQQSQAQVPLSRERRQQQQRQQGKREAGSGGGAEQQGPVNPSGGAGVPAPGRAPR